MLEEGFTSERVSANKPYRRHFMLTLISISGMFSDKLLNVLPQSRIMVMAFDMEQ